MLTISEVLIEDYIKLFNRALVYSKRRIYGVNKSKYLKFSRTRCTYISAVKGIYLHLNLLYYIYGDQSLQSENSIYYILAITSNHSIIIFYYIYICDQSFHKDKSVFSKYLNIFITGEESF